MKHHGNLRPVKSDPMTIDGDSSDFVHRGPSQVNQLFNDRGITGVKNDPCSTMTSDPYPWLEEPATESGLSILGGNMKKLIHGIQKLRHLGIEDLNVPLPKIVVVGDQSTGKSSLVEGMSEIKVPREAGCCTRCPLEINLTESEHGDGWICKVFLHKKYVYEGTQATAEDGASKGRPLGPWRLQNPEDYLFATAKAKNDVEEILRWAQLATLNPGESYEMYKPGENSTTPNTIQVKFSPNVVRVDISGPDLPNLSFYDLPGVINDPEVEDERYLIALVKNLVNEYICTDSSINLLALPMTTDATNCSAKVIVLEANAQDRTMGVLTKPDKLDKNDLTQWAAILGGQKFKLGFGYFVVKNNPDAGVDHKTARIQEEKFFNDEESFNQELVEYKQRFGTKKLQEALSHRLTSKIATSLPRIEDQIRKRAAAVKKELATLPENPTGNLQLIVHTKISDFGRELQMHLDGGSEECPFQFDWNKSALRFRKAIAESRPMFSPSITTANTASRVAQTIPGTPCRDRIKAAMVISDSDDSLPHKPCPPRTPVKRERVCEASKPTTPRKRRRLNDTVHQFTLAEIKGIIGVAYVAIPGQTHPTSIERMIRTSVGHWDELTTLFLDETEELCGLLIKQRVSAIFGPLRLTQLYRNTIEICEDFIGEAMQKQRAASTRNLNMEIYKPMTFNEEALEEACDKAKKLLQETRRDQRCNFWLTNHEAKSGKVTTGPARDKELAKITDAQLRPDPYSQELVALSKVRGYYEHASSRYVDAIGQGVQCELFKICRNDLPNLLVRKLGIDQDDASGICLDLLVVNKESAQRRKQLEKEAATLLAAEEQLQSLVQDAPGDESSQDTLIN